MIEHFHGTMHQINEHVKILRESYGANVRIINLCSTPSAFDIFYEFRKGG